MNLIRMIGAVRHELPRVIPLFRDARVPAWSKALAVLVALIIVSPLNLLGDIPLLGFFDDGALLLFVLHTFVKYAEKRAYIESDAIAVN